MIELEQLLTYLTLISVPIGVFYHILMLNNTRKNQQMQLETRQIATYLDYTNRLTKDIFKTYIEFIYYQEWETVDEWWDKYGPTNPDVYIQFLEIMDQIQAVGVLVDKGILDFELFYEDRAYSLLRLWERVEPIVYHMREKLENPVIYPHAEQLMKRLVKHHRNLIDDFIITSR